MCLWDRFVVDEFLCFSSSALNQTQSTYFPCSTFSACPDLHPSGSFQCELLGFKHPLKTRGIDPGEISHC